MEMSRDKNQKKKNVIRNCQVTMTKKDAYISNELQLQNHSLLSFHKNKSLPSATSIISRSPVAYHTTASFDKLTCTDYVDFGNCQDRFGRLFWSKNDSNYLDVKLKVLKRSDNKESNLVKKNLTMGEIDFNQFMPLRNRLVFAAKNFARERKMCPQCWYQHCPKTWMNNSKRLTRWLT